LYLLFGFALIAAGTKWFDGVRVMDDPGARALWLQELTRRGVLILTTFNICSALDEKTVTTVLSGFAHAFKRVALAKEKGVSPAEWVDGPLPVPAFRAR